MLLAVCGALLSGHKGIDKGYVFFKLVFVEGVAFEFAAIGINRCDAASQDAADLLVIGDVKSDERENPQFGVEAFVLGDKTVVGLEQLVDFFDKVGIYI